MLKDSAGAAVPGDDGQPLYGITGCNVPVGSRRFVERYLEQKKTKIVKGLDKAVSLLDPCRWPHPEIPTRQMIWVLTLVCFQNMGDYWLRHILPDYTEQFARDIDDGIRSLFQTCVGCDITRWSDFAKERIRLPICFKGCRLQEAVDRRHGKFGHCWIGRTATTVVWRGN